MSNKEEYLLKKEEKEKRMLSNQRKKKFISAGKWILVFIAVFFSTFFLVSKLLSSSEKANVGTPKLEITQTEYDFGDISMADGKVTQTYELKNVGDGDLKIDEIKTSCMCTVAKLKVGDEESGEFGMHTSGLLWSQKIAPGETGYLDVTFDPAYHGPEAVGPIVRVVYISTNDPSNKEAQVTLLANVKP